MNLLYRVIFRNGHWWWGKVAAGAMIGAIALGKSAHVAKEPYIAKNWITFGAVGGTIGLMASLILIAKDISRGIEIHDEKSTPTRVPPWWGRALLAFSITGTLAAIVVGILSLPK
jgi:hypothetical protein